MVSDYVVAWMQDGDLKSIKEYIQSLDSINDYIYIDDENCLNIVHLAAGVNTEFREEIIELLIELKADLNCPGRSETVEGVRPIHLAAMWGYDLTVKLLLYHGVDASLKDSNGLSPVDYASIFDNYICLRLLLRYGSLNASTSAWSAIMDSSLTDSNTESSVDTYGKYVISS